MFCNLRTRRRFAECMQAKQIFFARGKAFPAHGTSSFGNDTAAALPRNGFFNRRRLRAEQFAVNDRNDAHLSPFNVFSRFERERYFRTGCKNRNVGLCAALLHNVCAARKGRAPVGIVLFVHRQRLSAQRDANGTFF